MADNGGRKISAVASRANYEAARIRAFQRLLTQKWALQGLLRPSKWVYFAHTEPDQSEQDRPHSR